MQIRIYHVMGKDKTYFILQHHPLFFFFVWPKSFTWTKGYKKLKKTYSWFLVVVSSTAYSQFNSSAISQDDQCMGIEVHVLS